MLTGEGCRCLGSVSLMVADVAESKRVQPQDWGTYSVAFEIRPSESLGKVILERRRDGWCNSIARCRQGSERIGFGTVCLRRRSASD